MERFTLDELTRAPGPFDAAVAAAPHIDRFCSSTDWILPAREAWAADLEPFLLRGQHGFAAMLSQLHESEIRLLTGFDLMWGFSCPLVGADPHALVSEFATACAREEWHVLLLTGVAPSSPLAGALREAFADCEIHTSPVLRRWVASLEGGLDEFLKRRSGKFRGNLRRAQRRAKEAAVTLEPGAGETTALLDRILAVEGRSWKGPVRTGLLIDDMIRFYRPMVQRLAADGRLRTVFARRGNTDIGYILGGVRGGEYRGFQFSFDRAYAALSLGALLQQAQIALLCEEGVATYDLGIDMDYKRRWADRAIDTTTFVAVRSALRAPLTGRK